MSPNGLVSYISDISYTCVRTLSMAEWEPAESLASDEATERDDMDETCDRGEESEKCAVSDRYDISDMYEIADNGD